ncbi:MAG TPA: DUF2268 domain-containing putative Zn-dependent protease [Thermoanaerobaculia bacterium]|nr:DUF2268 domain-containing putative Zn-dependent protease [Thermoanaerobaculia bacterium]
MNAGRLFLLFVLLAPSLFAEPPRFVPIADAREKSVGTNVTVLGLVSVPSAAFASSADNGFAVEDQTGGIWVSTKDDLKFALGQRVLVQGTLATSFAKLQIDAEQVTPLDGRDLRVATGQVGVATLGDIITVEGTIVRMTDDRPYGTKLFVNDGSGEAQVFVATSTGITTKFAAGQSIRVTGFGSVYEKTYELEVRTQSDVQVLQRFITDDIPRFWSAYDRAMAAKTAEERTRIFQEQYLDAGTPGLADYAKSKIRSARELAEFVYAQRAYYDSIRANTLRVGELESRIRGALSELTELYPEAQFPDVYFVIGRLNSGGTISERGLLIGAEMYGVAPQTPVDALPLGTRRIVQTADALPHTVVHELIHFQQKPTGTENLLFGVMIEGGAEFLADLVLPAPRKPFFREWGEAHAEQVWTKFEADHASMDWSGWIGGNAKATEAWPADLGYYVGYELARAYYDRAADKKAAIRELLNFHDASRFLAR